LHDYFSTYWKRVLEPEASIFNTSIFFALPKPWLNRNELDNGMVMQHIALIINNVQIIFIYSPKMLDRHALKLSMNPCSFSVFTLAYFLRQI